jgi:sialate O-acetylesterase
MRLTFPNRSKLYACAALAAALAVTASASAATDALRLPAMFQDHAVLQRDRPIPLWGSAQPGEDIRIAIAGDQVRVHADAHGHWQAKLPALHAGGPYTLTVTAGGVTRRIDDVLVGDVWLCSGQSNMELPVRRTLNARAEMADADNDGIRMLKISPDASVLPRADFAMPLAWRKTTPATVGDFSATCYYFARELQKTEHVPLGLIDASLGGARIEAWMSAGALRKVGGYDEALDLLTLYATDPVAAGERWGRIWERWWQGLPDMAGEQPWKPGQATGAPWRDAPAQLGPWEDWGVPELAEFNGMLWYRTTVTLSAQQAAQDAVLTLGEADEVDVSWVNGRAVGSGYIGHDRVYRLLHGLLHAGDNEIVINVLDTYGEGGLTGPASKQALHLADGTSVPLKGWQYRVVPEQAGTPPLAPWLSAGGKTTLYNAMVAPLGHYGLRGAVWYQGESNTGDAETYAGLLRAYRNDLRAQFGKSLSLLIVQLAGYGPAPVQPGESGWAALREAQRKVAADDPLSGLAVAVDIGERSDIHPANKQELGIRLARVARHVTYGEALPPSGPVPRAVRREGDAIAVRFGDVSGGLVAYGAVGPVGFELCGRATASCHYATARIRGDEVLLQAPNTAEATRVRYGWADSPVVTLYDGAGLPAGPFEMPIP